MRIEHISHLSYKLRTLSWVATTNLVSITVRSMGIISPFLIRCLTLHFSVLYFNLPFPQLVSITKLFCSSLQSTLNLPILILKHPLQIFLTLSQIIYVEQHRLTGDSTDELPSVAMLLHPLFLPQRLTSLIALGGGFLNSTNSLITIALIFPLTGFILFIITLCGYLWL